MAPDQFHVRGCTQSQLHTPACDLRLMVPDRPAHDIDVHRHAEAHCILIVRGHYRTSATRNVHLHNGEPLLVLNPPRTEHVDCFDAAQVLPQAQFFSLTLSADRWFQVGHTMPLPAVPMAMEGPIVRRMAQAWLQHVTAHAQTDAMFLESSMLDALTPFSQESAAQAMASSRWVLRAQQRLRDAVVAGEDLPSVTDVATELGVHPVYMARAFRKHVGLSPSDYVRAVQLDKAAWLVRHSRRPLAEIALECHYFDQAHLAHAFKVAYGLSPSAHRLRALQ